MQVKKTLLWLTVWIISICAHGQHATHIKNESGKIVEIVYKGQSKQLEAMLKTGEEDWASLDNLESLNLNFFTLTKSLAAEIANELAEVDTLVSLNLGGYGPEGIKLEQGALRELSALKQISILNIYAVSDDESTFESIKAFHNLESLSINFYLFPMVVSNEEALANKLSLRRV